MLSWPLRLGDPTFVGYLTVMLYFLTAYFCYILARRSKSKSLEDLREKRLWLALAVLFCLLGLNKQLDFHSTLTQYGRAMSIAQGWYGQRRLVQLVFVASVAAVGGIVLLALLLWLRRSSKLAIVAVLGTGMLITYIVVRAASFHDADRVIAMRLLGLRWSWVLEIAGIIVVLTACLYRLRSTSSEVQRQSDETTQI